jgi:hypothetical protein
MKRNIQKINNSKSGVYKITNLINKKYYIGSTKHLASRYRTHLCNLKANKSPCIILQNAINKYGIDNFSFDVIKVTDKYKELEIDILNDNFPPYNIIKETKVRREISKETRLKMSLGRRGKPAHNKGIPRSSTFRVYKGMLVQILQEDVIVFTGTMKECASYLNMSLLGLYYPLKNNRPVKQIFKLKKL